MNAPGAKTNANIPSPSHSFVLNTDKPPNNSLTKPITVSDSEKPNPMPIPSKAESKTEFLQAKASALPRTIQLTTISGINKPNVAYRSG